MLIFSILFSILPSPALAAVTGQTIIYNGSSSNSKQETRLKDVQILMRIQKLIIFRFLSDYIKEEGILVQHEVTKHQLAMVVCSKVRCAWRK